MSIEKFDISEENVQENKESKSKENLLENLEPLIDAALLHAVKINEGNNGVITEIRLEDMPEVILDYFKEAYPDFFSSAEKGSVATKILKIYVEGAGREEARLQEKAYDIVENNNEDGLAKIPKLFLDMDVPINSDELRKHLENSGVQFAGNRIEIIMMDFIKGIDLANYIYRKIALKHPKLKDLKQQIEDGSYVDFDDLQINVNDALGFEKPGQGHRADVDNDFEREVVFGNNVKKMIEFMKKEDIVLDPKIFSAVEKTLSTLHEKGVYHLDMHERNVMLQLDEKGEVEDVYIIDFGSAVESKDGSEQEDRLYDDMLNDRYKELTISSLERQNKKNDSFKKHLESYEKRLQESKWKEKWLNVSDEISSAIQLEDNEEVLEELDYLIGGKLSQMSRADKDFYFDLISIAIFKIAESNIKLAKEYLNIFLKKDDSSLLAVKNNLRGKVLPLIESFEE